MGMDRKKLMRRERASHHEGVTKQQLPFVSTTGAATLNPFSASMDSALVRMVHSNSTGSSLSQNGSNSAELEPTSAAAAAAEAVSRFVIGSSGIDDPMLITTTAPSAAAAAKVDNVPGGTAPSAQLLHIGEAQAPAALPPVAAAVPVATVAPVAATLAPVAGTVAPVTATIAPATLAPVVGVVPASPVPLAADPAAAAAPKPAGSSDGGSTFWIFVVLILSAIVLGVVFFMRKRMAEPGMGGRLQLFATQANTDTQHDSQFWKSAKSRMSYRKSSIAHGPMDDSGSEHTKSSEQSQPRASISASGRGRRASRAVAGLHGSEDSATGTETKAVPSASSYQSRRDRSTSNGRRKSEAPTEAAAPAEPSGESGYGEKYSQRKSRTPRVLQGQQQEGQDAVQDRQSLFTIHSGLPAEAEDNAV